VPYVCRETAHLGRPLACPLASVLEVDSLLKIFKWRLHWAGCNQRGVRNQRIPGGRKRNMRPHFFHKAKLGRSTSFDGRKPLSGILTRPLFPLSLQCESSQIVTIVSRCAFCDHQPCTRGLQAGFERTGRELVGLVEPRDGSGAGTGAVQRSRGCWPEHCCGEAWPPYLTTL